ncbi:MAG: hypothetical protein JRI22_05715 [Deltaproteobacteria bacterium]|nr:hypothetical protein [Deltaproteobacteria bacterium]
MPESTVKESILVDTHWLREHLDNPGIRIVDLRWRPRFVSGRRIAQDRREDYLAGHVPGRYF